MSSSVVDVVVVEDKVVENGDLSLYLLLDASLLFAIDALTCVVVVVGSTNAVAI